MLVPRAMEPYSLPTHLSDHVDFVSPVTGGFPPYVELSEKNEKKSLRRNLMEVFPEDIRKQYKIQHISGMHHSFNDGVSTCHYSTAGKSTAKAGSQAVISFLQNKFDTADVKNFLKAHNSKIEKEPGVSICDASSAFPGLSDFLFPLPLKGSIIEYSHGWESTSEDR